MPLFDGLSSLSLINEKHTTVVIDIGSAYTKVGFAGECGPRAVIKSRLLLSDGSYKSIFSHENPDELRHNLTVFIRGLYFKHLLVNPKDRRVVVIENILLASVVRETIAAVLFRYCEALSVLFAPTHLLALMPLGISTALVLDIGFEESTLIPICEGIPILHAWQALPLAGKKLHRSLNDLLLDRALCKCSDGTEKRLSLVMDAVPEDILEDIKVRACFVSTCDRSEQLVKNKYDRSVEPPPPPPKVDYPLKGEMIFVIPGIIREMASEIWFERDEDNLSLPTMFLDAIVKCPIDMRKELAENLVIIGGSSIIPGLKHRLLCEIKKLALSPLYFDTIKLRTFKIHVPPAKDNYVAWLGGSIIGCTEAVGLRSLSREAYLKDNYVPDWCNLSGSKRGEKTA